MRAVLIVALLAAVGVVWMLASGSDPPSRAPAGRETGRDAAEPHGDATPQSEPKSGPKAGPKTGSATGGSVRLTGSVVDSSRRPLPSCTVTMTGAEPVETGEDGGFEFFSRRPSEGETKRYLFARDGRGNGGRQSAVLKPDSPDEIELAPIVLAPARDLTVTVLAGGKPAGGARVVVFPDTGYGMWVSIEATADEAGVARFEALQRKEYVVLAATTGHGRGRATAEPDAQDVTVELPGERRIEIEVVEKGTLAPIKGAVLTIREMTRKGGGIFLHPHLPALDVAPTDERGRTVIGGLAQDTTLRITPKAGGYPPPSPWARRPQLNPGMDFLRIEMDLPRTVRWPVVQGESPVPPHGAQIGFRPMVGSGIAEITAKGRMEHGTLVGDGFGSGPVHAIAIAPDGSLARVYARSGDETGSEVSFSPPRHVEVFVREKDGTPVQGARVVLRNQGNNEFAPAKETDADGFVRFDGLHGRRADVHYGTGQARIVGTVDLDKGSGTVHVVLEPERELLIRLKVDGKPGLPTSYHVWSQDSQIVQKSEDAATGEIRLTARPHSAGSLPHIAVSAAGYVTARGRSENDVVELDLESAATLVLKVVPAPDKRERIELFTQNDQTQTWQQHYLGMGAVNARNERKLELSAGRYVVRDQLSGRTAGPIDLAAGATAHLALDLSTVGWAEGRVEWPEGTRPREVRVVVDTALDLRSLQDQFGGSVRGDGSFRVRIPGDRAVTLRPVHPVLRAARTARVTRPGKGFVLRLEQGPSATLSLDPPPRRLGLQRTVRVLLYRGPARGKPLSEHKAQIGGDEITFGGFEPGRYTLWVDSAPAVPLVLEGVELEDGKNDLGAHKPGTGSTIKVRILVKKGESAPRVSVFAWSEEQPRYTRGLNSNGETEVKLTGLGAGRFRVRGSLVMGRSKAGLDEVVTLDGQGEITLTMDLR